MERLRRIVRSALRRADDLYRVRHKLQPVGPILLVGRARYHGPARRFADGTQLGCGDDLGTLHFDNARIAALDAETPNAIGLSFAAAAAAVAAKLSRAGSRGWAFRRPGGVSGHRLAAPR